MADCSYGEDDYGEDVYNGTCDASGIAIGGGFPVARGRRRVEEEEEEIMLLLQLIAEE